MYYGAYDEQWYLSQYPDIRDAVARGALSVGYLHYDMFGRREGRSAFQFDEAYYVAAYPLVAQEIAEGLARTPREHYELLGWARGYLPYLKAERRKNPQVAISPFGGLWPDLPHAADLIAGRLEIGMITQQQAELLRSWIANGYVILPSAIPEEEIVRAEADLERAYQGGFGSQLMFESAVLGGKHAPWQADLRDAPAKALDMHWFSRPVRDLIFSEKVRGFLQLIFEARAFASQTLGFYRGSAQEAHQDSAYVPYTLQRHFAASWIALEDVAFESGELFYYEGSHKLPEFLYLGGHKSVSEAYRAGGKEDAVNDDIRRHVRLLPRSADTYKLTKRTFMAKRGDALIWHADLAHGGSPISTTRSRKSVVTHYCPYRILPPYFERMKCAIHDHGGKGYFSSSHYREEQFVE